MKHLIIATALLSGLALAEKLLAGAACGTNADCNDNCLDSRWAPANQDGKYTFVCDPDLADGTLWYEGICDLIKGTVPVADREKTKAACASLGARSAYGHVCFREAAAHPMPQWLRGSRLVLMLGRSWTRLFLLTLRQVREGVQLVEWKAARSLQAATLQLRAADETF